jgi:hypothetical protein
LFNASSKNAKTLTRKIKFNSFINLKERLENTGINEFYGEGWDTIYKEYIDDKTLGEFLAKVKQDPTFLAPLLFSFFAITIDNNDIFGNRY